MRRLVGLIFVAFLGCGGTERTATTPASAEVAPDDIELVESVPIETSLDHTDVRDAAVVWPEMIDRAQHAVALSEFYASDAEGDAAKKSRLAPVLSALERATARGVKVRFLADKVMAPKYPQALDRLRTAGIDVRIIDCGPRYGGVQHAKYMVVDGVESFVGSQNFDWRALEHIQEMGARVRSPAIAGGLLDLFDTDWALAEKTTPAAARSKAHAARPAETKTRTGEAVALYASPKGWLADEARWDLTRIVALLDGARTEITLQVLTYSTENRDKSAFTTLDEALRRAAARGVRVRLLVSSWGANAGSAARRSIEALAALPNVEVRVLTIPAWSGGEIPFARVAHAKYLVVDARTAWIGTSNWEGDYFLKTRNVALVAEGGALAPRLARIFEDGWGSTYAAPLTPAAATPRAKAPAADAPRPSSSDPAPP